MNIRQIKNASDCVPLCVSHNLYLKPIAKFNISVTLPTSIMDKTSLFNSAIIDKLRKIIYPNKYVVLKATKYTYDFIRYEAVIDDRKDLKFVLSRINGKQLKLDDIDETCKIRAAEAKDDFPTRHDCDAYFRCENMNAKKDVERPDTIHFSNLPIRWFCPKDEQNNEIVKPSECIFKQIFSKFGNIKAVDIPICDPYRNNMIPNITGITTNLFDTETFFDGYVQFKNYMEFIKTMDMFRGMKLVRKEFDEILSVEIKVDFDKTQHLSEWSIEQRNNARVELIAKEKKEEYLKLQRKHQEMQNDLEKQRLHQNNNRIRNLMKHMKEKNEIDIKIQSEEQKLLIVQRKLESIRILDTIFERIKLKWLEIQRIQTESADKHFDNSYECNEVLATNNNSNDNNNNNNTNNNVQNKLAKQFKIAQEQEFERHKNRLKKVKSGGGLLGASLKDLTPSPIINSNNSDNIMDSTKYNEKKKKSKKKIHEARSTLKTSTRKHKDKNPMPLSPNVTGIYPMLNPGISPWLNQSVYSFPMPYCDIYPIQALPPVMPMYNSTVPQFMDLSNSTMFTSYGGDNKPYIINHEPDGVLHKTLDNCKYESNFCKEIQDRIVPLIVPLSKPRKRIRTTAQNHSHSSSKPNAKFKINQNK